MKKIYMLMVGVLICVATLMTGLASGRMLGEAQSVDYGVWLDSVTRINSLCEQPILEYDGKSYVSIRDMSALFDYKVGWDEEKRLASFERVPSKPNAVETAETAQVIAQAVIKGQFPDKVTEKTIFETHVDKTDEKYYGATYIVNVYFNPQETYNEDVRNADVVLSVKAENGVVDILHSM